MSELKKDDKVVCINNEYIEKHLTIGKVYKIANTECNGRTRVINDNGDVLDYFAYRFRLATLLEKELSE